MSKLIHRRRSKANDSLAPRRSVLIRSAILLLAVSLSACTLPRPPTPVAWSVSEKSRASIGKILLAPAQFRPQALVNLPAKGAAEGASRGAAIGLVAPVGIGAQAGAGGLVLGILLAPFTTVIGTGVGASKALSAEDVEKAEQTIKTAFSETNLHSRLASVLRKRIEADTDHSVVSTIPGPKSEAGLPNYSPAAGANAVVEVRVSKVALEGPWSINPPIKFVLEAHARLIHLSGNRLLWDRHLSYEGPKQTLTEWSHDQASPLRKQFVLGTTAMAEIIVEELFLLHIPRGMAEGET